LSIGAKRNLACERANGEIVVHWDDDDWYGEGRLAAQVMPILSGEADISALNDTLFFDLDRWEFWRCSAALHRRMFVEDVHGGTLAYRRTIGQHSSRFPDTSLAEDALFLRQAVGGGARLQRICGSGHFIYLRHGRNSWSFACGHFLDPSGWERSPEPLLLPEDRAFFAAHTRAQHVTASRPPPEEGGAHRPLVSCIMPTANRPDFVPQALRCFLRQTYAPRELLILDDGELPVEHLVPPDPRIRYLRLAQRRSVGAKRNLACEAARGSIIAHWDDDDWAAPWRLEYQVQCLLDSSADICGLDRILYFDLRSRGAWLYHYGGRTKPWLGGNTLCYYKDLWRRNRFADVSIGEDNGFIWSTAPRRVLALPKHDFLVALIHSSNVSPKQPAGIYWQHQEPQVVLRMMQEDSEVVLALA
jgi:glycosyltransferase involved in cell wall biosynthesis